MSIANMNIENCADLINKGISEELRELIHDRLKKVVDEETSLIRTEIAEISKQAANNVTARVQTYSRMGTTDNVVVAVAFNGKVIQE